MAKRSKHRKLGGRVTPPGTRPPGARRESVTPPTDRDEPDLMRSLRAAMSEPFDLLAAVSSLLTISAPRTRNPFDRDRLQAGPTREQVVGTFIDVDSPETTAVLNVIAALSVDDVERRRIRRSLDRRLHALPPWLAGLADARATRTVRSSHVFDDGDNLMIEVRLGGGEELTGVLYVDHNLGTVAKDGYVVPGPIDDVIRLMHKVNGDDPDVTCTDVDPADTRARATEAIAIGAMTVPPFETDAWPQSRPLIEWMLRLLPAGGQGHPRREWSDRERAELADRFFASTHGAGLDDAEHRGLLDEIIWLGTAHGPGDPRHLSPVAIELLLVDRIPRKVARGADYLGEAPTLLRHFVGFCHGELGIRPSLTEESLAAIDRWEPTFQQRIRSKR